MALRAARKKTPSDKSLRKFRRKVGLQNLPDALELLRADYEAHPGADAGLFDAIKQRYEEMEERESIVPRPPLLTGHDIMQELGISRGPIIGSMKKYLEELYDEDPNIDKETALLRLHDKFDPDGL